MMPGYIDSYDGDFWFNYPQKIKASMMLCFADSNGEEVNAKREKQEDQIKQEDQTEFLSKRVAKRNKEDIRRKIKKIAELPDKKLWKLFKSLEGKPEKKKLYDIIKKILYDRFLPYVLSVADKYAKRKLPSRSLATIDDIRQAAVIAHLEGIDKYSPYYGLTYMQFINASGGKSRINGRIIDMLRKLQNLPRDVSKKNRVWKDNIQALSHKLGKKPTMEEICAEYGDEAKDICNDRLFNKIVLNQIDSESGENVFAGGESSNNFMDNFPVENKVTRATHDNRNLSSAREIILSMIDDERVRRVIEMYYYENIICDEIASTLKVSISTVSTLRNRGQRIILSKVTREEFEDLFID